MTAETEPLVRGLTSVPKPVMDLPGSDRFERLCFLQLLLMQGVVQIFVANATASVQADCQCEVAKENPIEQQCMAAA